MRHFRGVYLVYFSTGTNILGVFRLKLNAKYFLNKFPYIGVIPTIEQ